VAIAEGRGADRTIAELARRQHGVVARRQLLKAELSSTMIGRRLRAGRLHQLHHGIYLVGHEVPPTFAREMAALLACGPYAVLSHRSAAAISGLLSHPATAPVCVNVPPGRSVTRPRIEFHRGVLERRDVRHRHGMRLTSPPRTILDLSAKLDPDELERLIAEANYRRLASERELQDQLARNPGRRGSTRLRRIVGQPGGAHRTRSQAERRLLRLLRQTGVTGYETNARIHGYEVDVLWRELNFVVEIDGYDGHSGRVAFERDRLKLATLNASGVTVMPVTPNRLRDDPEGAVARLLRALVLAGYDGPPSRAPRSASNPG
jgi:very-short-patch-repair endonuclease